MERRSKRLEMKHGNRPSFARREPAVHARFSRPKARVDATIPPKGLKKTSPSPKARITAASTKKTFVRRDKNTIFVYSFFTL